MASRPDDPALMVPPAYSEADDVRVQRPEKVAGYAARCCADSDTARRLTLSRNMNERLTLR